MRLSVSIFARGAPHWLVNVRFGSRADIRSAIGHVRFTPETGHVQCTSPCLLWANSGHHRLFDHLVGASKQCWRHRKADVSRGLEIDEQREFGRLLDRQISGLRTL